jgi:hypothetical protein
LVWNGKVDALPERLRIPHDGEIQLRVIPFEENSLLNRFHPSLAIKTEAVVYLDDDDAPPSVTTLRLGFATWRCDPLRITYLHGRPIVNGERDLAAYKISWYMPNDAQNAWANAGTCKQVA